MKFLRSRFPGVLSFAAAMTLGALSPAPVASAAALRSAAPRYKALVFWGVGGFAYSSRVPANAFLDSIGKDLGIAVDLSDTASVFTAERLSQYRVVVLNNNTEFGRLLSLTTNGWPSNPIPVKSREYKCYTTWTCLPARLAPRT